MPMKDIKQTKELCSEYFVTRRFLLVHYLFRGLKYNANVTLIAIIVWLRRNFVIAERLLNEVNIFSVFCKT